VSLEKARCCATAGGCGGVRSRVVGGRGVDREGDSGNDGDRSHDGVGDNDGDSGGDGGAFRGDLSNTERRSARGSACVP
jgi:hypothetical protein